MQNINKHNNSTDTIFFNKKDSISIQTNELKELNTSIGSIHYDLHNHLNKKEETFFGASYDTAFTVIFTILIFLTGILIDRWIKKRNEKEELKKIKSYFVNQFQ